MERSPHWTDSATMVYCRVFVGLYELAQAVIGLLWHVPRDAAEALWRTVFDRPGRGLPILAVFVLLPAFVLGVGIAARHSAWGTSLTKAWDAETRATSEEFYARALLDAHESNAPERDPDSRRAWQAKRAALQAQIDEAKQRSPSMLVPTGLTYAWPDGSAWLALVYHADHFLFGSVYGVALWGFLLGGIRPGWRSSNRCEMRILRRWRRVG